MKPLAESAEAAAEGLRASLLRVPLRPLEEFGYPWHTSPDFKPAMEAMLAGRWEKAGHFVTDMKPPINFDGQPRPHACDLHSWEPLGYALRALEIFGDRRYLELSCRFAFDWLDRYWRPVGHTTAPGHLDALIADRSTFAWYDMAVGRRVFRIAYLLDALARDLAFPNERLQQLWSALQFHHAVLGREHFFRAHSNHGIYQALGQAAAARRFLHMPGSAGQFALARERFVTLLDTHFTIEGAHLEHSPGYQYGLMASLIGASASGLLDERRLEERIRAMEGILSWMIMPDGRIVPLGDTDPKSMSRSTAFVSRFSNPVLQHQMSRGKLGVAAESGVKALLQSGYAFARLPVVSPCVPASVSYLAQIAAFHSNIHKHADHLSFVWHDRGRDILIDPGRYAYAGKTEVGSDLSKQGFWYSDPKRIYVESTRAHNCVEVDNRSYPRGRHVTPFGSALRYAGEQAGFAVTDCDVTHLRTIRHRRVLVLGPGHFLLVLDWLNDRTSPHDYRQWFQFAPEWEVKAAEHGAVAAAPRRGDRPKERLRVLNLIGDNAVAAPVRGQEEPQLQGWMSDAPYSLIPTTSLAVEALARPMGRFVTLFVFDDVALDAQATRFNATLRAGTVVWTDARGHHRLSIALGEPGKVAAMLVTGGQ